MEIVISLDKNVYELVKHFEKGLGLIDKRNDTVETALMRAIINGTPLPEHHGRIIDESKVHTIYKHTETNINNDLKYIRTIITRTDAPTIIEAAE